MLIKVVYSLLISAGVVLLICIFAKNRDTKTKIIVSAVGILLSTLLSFSGDISEIFTVKYLAEGQLAKYITYDLQDSSTVYDEFVSPEDKKFSFTVPDKYLYCIYKNYSGEEKTALSGEEIKAVEAKLIYCYTNENENKISISNSLAEYGDYHSFYINIYDTIMRYENTNFAQVHQFGFPLSGIRYIILDKDNNILAGGVSNGDTIEVSNAYAGEFILLMKGTEEQSLKEYKGEIVLDNDGLIIPNSDIGIDGVYFDKKTGKPVDFMDDNYVVDDTKSYWTLNIHMEYENKNLYDITFEQYEDFVYEGYVFDNESFIMMTSPDVGEERYMFGAIVTFENEKSFNFQILEGDYYFLPYVKSYNSEDDIFGGTLLDINEYQQIISIPKEIDGDTVYLELNPSNDVGECLRKLSEQSEDGDEYLTQIRCTEIMLGIDIEDFEQVGTNEWKRKDEIE